MAGKFKPQETSLYLLPPYSSSIPLSFTKPSHTQIHILQPPYFRKNTVRQLLLVFKNLQPLPLYTLSRSVVTVEADEVFLGGCEQATLHIQRLHIWLTDPNRLEGPQPFRKGIAAFLMNPNIQTEPILGAQVSACLDLKEVTLC